MRHALEIENIEEMRRQVGIDDVELHAEIRGLQVGDCIHLTLHTGTKAFASATVLVRITSIRGGTFRGKLLQGPAFRGLSSLLAGSPIRFTADHIHSIPQRQPRHEP
jgi:hypothetical protein